MSDIEPEIIKIDVPYTDEEFGTDGVSFYWEVHINGKVYKGLERTQEDRDEEIAKALAIG